MRVAALRRPCECSKRHFGTFGFRFWSIVRLDSLSGRTPAVYLSFLNPADASERAGSTVVEEKGSHAIYISKPEVVAALIEKAANSVKLAAN
jgi:hypothetical protein